MTTTQTFSISDFSSTVYPVITTITDPLLDIDLIVDNTSVPSTINRGESFTLSWTVKNQGSEATTTSYLSDDVYYSTDEIYDESDIYLTSGYWNTFLAGGESYSQSQTIGSWSTTDLPLGEGYLLVVTDGFDDQSETNEDNNTYAVTITVTQPDVDLVITSATVPSTIHKGDSFSLSWTVENQGSEATNGSYDSSITDVVYYSTDEVYDDLDTYLTSDSWYGSVAAGASYTQNQTVNNWSTNDLPLGEGYLLFVTNSADDLFIAERQTETNLDNNTYAIPVNIVDTPQFEPAQYGASYPDLIQAFGYDLTALSNHYFTYGQAEGRAVDTFDEGCYVAAYDDLIGAFGTNFEQATEHYLRYGFAEQRTTDGFNAAQYLASYDDLCDYYGHDFKGAINHFITHGFGEGRSRDMFEEDIYLASHGDLIEVLGYDLEAATNHYIDYGLSEGRAKNLFDPNAYLNKYEDLQMAFGNDLTAATRHFIEYGYYEGRTCV